VPGEHGDGHGEGAQEFLLEPVARRTLPGISGRVLPGTLAVSLQDATPKRQQVSAPSAECAGRMRGAHTRATVRRWHSTREVGKSDSESRVSSKVRGLGFRWHVACCQS
jgi:hypothetical protein